MKCARHPKVETALSCSRCTTPICPDCAVPGAVGMLCRDCASNRSSHVYQITTQRLVLAGIVGLIAGMVAGFLLNLLASAFFYMAIFVGPMLGGFVGHLVWLTAGRKRGLPLEIITGVTLAAGVAIVLLITGTVLSLMDNPLFAGVYLVALVLTVASAVGRIRYM